MEGAGHLISCEGMLEEHSCECSGGERKKKEKQSYAFNEEVFARCPPPFRGFTLPQISEGIQKLLKKGERAVGHLDVLHDEDDVGGGVDHLVQPDDVRVPQQLQDLDLPAGTPENRTQGQRPAQAPPPS